MQEQLSLVAVNPTDPSHSKAGANRYKKNTPLSQSINNIHACADGKGDRTAEVGVVHDRVNLRGFEAVTRKRIK